MSINEYLAFINKNINRTDFRYKYLIAVLDTAFGQGNAVISASTVILTAQNEWIIYIETDVQLFIYGDNNVELIAELSSRISFEKFAGFEVMGEYNLTHKLLENKNVKMYYVIKERIFYRLNNTQNLLQTFEDTEPSPDDIGELTQMMLDYYVEEYQGTRNKTVEQIHQVVKQHLEYGSIFINRQAGTIRAFCTVTNPDIGILYTKKEFRNLGIGKRLLSACSGLLFELNHVCYLMTDLGNQASNKACRDIGYEEIYRHTNIRL